ncbi:MAG: DHH family phosphoesterase [Nanoarchaeota archaeon]|nr:DHH family phosphoesterase [Nanoarchaeota archaeon]
MERRGERLKLEIKRVSKEFLEEIKNKHVIVVSHFDTDGISSAAIMVQALKKRDQQFSLKIVKSLNKEFIDELPKDKTILFLDLASGSFNHLKEAKLKKVYIIDHHEINQEIPDNISIINPQLLEKQKISSSGLVYLFCKELDESNKEYAKLAVLGMIGDNLEKEIDNLNNGILEDGEVKRKRGILIYPSTRPLNRTLEFSSSPFIPGVTGNTEGVRDLIREAGIIPEKGKYKSIIDLTEEETKNLTTGIILRNPEIKEKKLVGDIFLIKLFGKLEDAREISAKINACSRMGESTIALKLCMESLAGKKRAESIHAKYRQMLISGLKKVDELEKIQGEKFMIINARQEIKDTMIGTVVSILSHSSLYKEETVLIGLAEDKDRIKVSARNVGSKGRNVREILSKVINSIGGEVGGHEFAAGCTISQEKEKEFIDLLKKDLELQVVKF